MPDPGKVIAVVVRIDPSVDKLRASDVLQRSPEGVTIVFEDGQTARVLPGERSAGMLEVLEGLRKLRTPAYVEVQSEGGAITRLLIPHVGRVLRVRPLDDARLAVELEYSHARHVLSRDHPAFAGLQSRLREAVTSRQPVIVTEDDRHFIIDVRPVPAQSAAAPPSSGPGESPREVGPQKRSIEQLLRLWWFWPPRGCVSKAKAQQVFDALNATSCNPMTVPPPCIPFLYPDDGCWGRAHEMCRLMIQMSVTPRKVWIQGVLHVNTRNNPNCEVWWGWHVAPTLCVRTSFFRGKLMVIDPALFGTPVSKAAWKGVQGDPNATLTDSDASIFYLWGGLTDPSYVQTNQVLAYYRLQLHNRSLTYGPPPYASCP